MIVLNEMYSEVREHLRQQHAANTQEIHGKKVDNLSKYRYYGNDGLEEATTPLVPFSTKVFLFFTCVMLFSCYIYGGQDVEKGARMAWAEMQEQVLQLEKEEPAVKQAMSYVRKAYDEVKDFSKTYMNVGE